MTCAGCGDHVADALRGVDGVETVRMGDWTEGRASVTTERGVVPEDLTAAVADAGYTAHVETARSSSTPISPDDCAEADYDLVVVGGGYIALENVQAFARLGSEVTVFQRSG